ncbi:MAG: FKBP-type peptidyl-prolyl cis-trans isomerase [Bacteroidota bacterium]|nr:FKBP-type peptidyl-prolyl cis-trans isomerase [Bacteroidota bacterium]
MKKRLVFLALAAIALASCNGGFTKGDGGMEYKILDDKSGPSIKEGDFISFNFIVKTDADSVLQSTYEKGQPIRMPVPKLTGKGNIMTPFSTFSEGDSAIIKVNIDSMSKGHPRPKELKGKFLVYVIKVEKVIAKGNLSDTVFQGRVRDYIKNLSEEAKAKEPAAIKKYIDDNKLKVTTTASGLNYVITQQGSGPLPVVGDTVVVNYTGRFMNGKIFETSVKAEAIKNKMQINPMNPYKPIRFALGGGMIQGFTEGFQLFNKGTKATLVIPSKLAYGDQGSQMMQPYTPLAFDVEVVDIIHPNPNAPKPAQPAMPTVQAPVKK